MHFWLSWFNIEVKVRVCIIQFTCAVTYLADNLEIKKTTTKVIYP